MRNAEDSLHEVPFKLPPEHEARTVLSSSLGLVLQYSGWRRAHSGAQLAKEPCLFVKIYNWSPGNPKKAKNIDNCHVSIFNLELLPNMKSVWHQILQGVSVCESLQNDQRILL